MRPEIYFFTNGNIDTGMGHIVRSLILAKEFKQIGFDPVFILPSNTSFEDKIESKGFEYYKVTDFSQENEVKDILLLSEDFKICIIDSIESEYVQLEYLSNINSLFLVTITLFLFELENRYENLSFYPSFKTSSSHQYLNKNDRYFNLYEGKEYFIFNDRFANIKKEIKEVGHNILITMGGSDPFNITLKVLNSIETFNDKDITVILNNKSLSYNDVLKICSNRSLTLKDYVEDIEIYMEDADLIILNGGTTRYEACLSKTPFIAISIHQKQFDITKRLTDIIGAINIGVVEDVSSNQLNDTIEELLVNYELRKEISQKMENSLDVKGKNRICDTIIAEFNLYKSQ